jgi:hypothetical protein
MSPNTIWPIHDRKLKHKADTENTQDRRSTPLHEANNPTIITGRTPEMDQGTTPPRQTTRSPLAHSTNSHGRFADKWRPPRPTQGTSRRSRNCSPKQYRHPSLTACIPAPPPTPRRQCRPRPHFDRGSKTLSRKEPVNLSVLRHRRGHRHTKRLPGWPRHRLAHVISSTMGATAWKEGLHPHRG